MCSKVCPELLHPSWHVLAGEAEHRTCRTTLKPERAFAEMKERWRPVRRRTAWISPTEEAGMRTRTTSGYPDEA